MARSVTVEGVVTALSERGFWMESLRPDRSAATSEGVFVSVSTADLAEPVAPGDRVRVRGMLAEEQRNADELPVTTLIVARFAPEPTEEGSDTAPGPEATGEPEGDVSSASGPALVERLAAGETLPMPPVLEATSLDTLEQTIDFWERREGMRVTLPSSVVVGATNRYGEAVILPLEHWPKVALNTDGLPILDPKPDDLPAITALITIDDEITKLPVLRTGDHLASFVGIVDYRFGAYRVLPIAPLETTSAAKRTTDTQEPASSTNQADDNCLMIASINLENLDLGDGPQRFRAIARWLVERLGSPDLIALQEIQDDNGPINDAVTSSDLTHGRLIAAISALGGPRYAFRDIHPLDDEDGGQPGGNIRASFLYRRDRGLHLLDRAGGNPTTTAAHFELVDGGPALLPSPGRIAPRSAAFVDSRKPLVAELTWHGHRLFVVNVHLASKTSDDPVYGSHRPPRTPSALQRGQQTREIARFVQSALELDPAAWILVVGDYNDTPSAESLEPLKDGGLIPLLERVPPDQRYSYVYRGQAQAIDQAYASTGLLADTELEVSLVHGNAALPESERVTDHDSLLLGLRLAPKTPPRFTTSAKP